MNEEYVFHYLINGKEIRNTSLSQEEWSLLMSGVDYAMHKDFDSKRKTKYRELLWKLNEVVRGS